MKSKLWTVLTAAALFAFAAAPTFAARPGTGGTDVPVSGTVSNIVGSVSNVVFTGVLNITGFEVIDGVLNAVGTLTGVVSNATGVVTLPAIPVTVPVTAAGATCDILNLDLGPLHLDLLGLVIDLAPVNLDITAEPGSGNLLGNLLCSVSRLLDRGGSLDQLGRLLDRILGQL